VAFDAYRRKRSKAADINLTPVMNLFVVLIPFLLLSAAFFHVGVIPASLPTQSAGASDVEEQLRAVTLTMQIESDAIHVSASNPSLAKETLAELAATLPRSGDGGFREDEMKQLLIAIKQRFPESDTIMVLPGRGTIYRDVVSVLDVARDHEGTGGSRVPLFPVAVMSRRVED